MFLNRLIATKNCEAKRVPKDFIVQQSLNSDYVKRSFEFSKEMVYGQGHHREAAFGLGEERNKFDIFINTFQGKLAECQIYEYFQKKGIPYNVSEPDFSIMGYGKWDTFDFQVKKGNIDLYLQVKSTKHFGQLLLLEKHDWNDNGEYIPNAKNNGQLSYDYFVLTRVKPENDIKINEYDILNNTENLKKFIYQNWFVEITGVLNRDDFVNKIIKYKYILPKGYLLGKTPLKVDNYYCQAGDLGDIDAV